MSASFLFSANLHIKCQLERSYVSHRCHTFSFRLNKLNFPVGTAIYLWLTKERKQFCLQDSSRPLPFSVSPHLHKEFAGGILSRIKLNKMTDVNSNEFHTKVCNVNFKGRI